MTRALLFILPLLLMFHNAGSLAEGRFCQLIDNLAVIENRCSVLPHRLSATSTYSTTYISHSGNFGGHEYLPYFGIYNANARLYDPLLGRFLSPDPYVQAQDFSINFNRYAWCLNNPLKYTERNAGQKSVNWQFKTTDARIKPKHLYPILNF